MAKASEKLITALRETANRVASGCRYEWGHMAHCNCGHLVQTVTDQDGTQISNTIKQSLDEWTEHANDLCALTGNPVEDMFTALNEYGFDRQDIIHLEWLSDKKVLNQIGDNVYLRRNERDDLVKYLRAMADMLEIQLATTTGLEVIAKEKDQVLI